MKYIIFEDFAGHPVPFIFPDRVDHADMREQLPYAKVISAGSVRLVDGSFVCSADDTNLDIGPNPADQSVIAKAFTQAHAHGS